MNLHQSTDARIWASEFIQIVTNPEKPVIIDEAFMIGWFANAIMAGYDQAKNEYPGEFRVWIEGQTKELRSTYLNDRHSCKYIPPSAGYGAAVSYCIEDENGKFWVGNDEYESQVNYCPFCGATAPTKIILGRRLGTYICDKIELTPKFSASG